MTTKYGVLDQCILCLFTSYSCNNIHVLSGLTKMNANCRIAFTTQGFDTPFWCVKMQQKFHLLPKRHNKIGSFEQRRELVGLNIPSKTPSLKTSNLFVSFR